MALKRRIGVFVCHCGGNISDHVDVEKVVAGVEGEPGVAVARTHMFTCSDSSQQEMIDQIVDEKLDGLVVASCSPKLHMFTFRGMSERAGLNPYQYVHVNLREQCSWAHTDDKGGATEKGIHLVRAGIAKCALTRPLHALRVETQPRALVVGAGIAGMRAALALADMGLAVFLVEREPEAGGWALQAGKMGPEAQHGPDVAARLGSRIAAHDNIMLYTGAELIEKSGSIGDFNVKVRVSDEDVVDLNVGAIVVATGFDTYQPREGEYGWGLDGVVDLKTFRQMMADGKLEHGGKALRDVVFLYCVGSRQSKSEACPAPNTYCSRYCCTAGTFAATTLHALEETLDQTVNQYHLYRDIRTYGHLEMVYEQARREGALFVRWDPENPPVVEQGDDRLCVKTVDTLAGSDTLEIGADLVVLVTGMRPRENDQLNSVLKIPESKDGFYNEIHIKLRPVETVIDGVFIAGASQGPKTLAESVASSLAAVAKAGGLLMKGYVDLEPLIAKIDTDKCTWCDACLKACPYGAIEKTVCGDKEVALVIASMCKGEGGCVPVCPHDAIDIEGFRDDQIRAMIDASLKEAVV
ncbi:MAG: CoB--CoM heterodisulfide reductase iron-sulfur subunit A family protein [Verrucomicrobia bacterium]|jgi:heterodisulfide reductase subunit A2|nr:CoB--CoM heterodisulfide reductase iron-sulfur subunit A family protein [Verrucomicrobiota bacterium]MBT7066392.1 CoB--CoM heterodisulfide reductase iron-sulfur subunit A family protein [Verrucomicrobiota bacterium]MBT7701540.1 CoB--CoM heterodisulfide reductase iron-sulfur subunit A family protein [Verrucomicrobiota bacterium]